MIMKFDKPYSKSKIRQCNTCCDELPRLPSRIESFITSQQLGVLLADIGELEWSALSKIPSTEWTVWKNKGQASWRQCKTLKDLQGVLWSLQRPCCNCLTAQHLPLLQIYVLSLPHPPGNSSWEPSPIKVLQANHTSHFFRNTTCNR